MKKFKDFLHENIWECIYVIASICLIIRMHFLNETLLEIQGDDSVAEKAIHILSYNDWEPVFWFVLVIMMIFVGGLIIYMRVKEIRNRDYYDSDLLKVLLVIMMILLVIIFLIGSIIIPIVQAMLVVGLITMGFIIK